MSSGSAHQKPSGRRECAIKITEDHTIWTAVWYLVCLVSQASGFPNSSLKKVYSDSRSPLYPDVAMHHDVVAGANCSLWSLINFHLQPTWKCLFDDLPTLNTVSNCIRNLAFTPNRDASKTQAHWQAKPPSVLIHFEHAFNALMSQNQIFLKKGSR